MKANAIGLDVGTSRIVVAKPQGDSFQYQSQLNAFVAIPYSKMSAMALQREGIPHHVESDELVVHGDESEKFADLMNAETRRPMNKGVLDAKEPVAVKMMQHIIGSLTNTSESGTRVCFTVPAAPLGAEESVTYHEATVRQVLETMGFEPKPINEGLAVVYSELESTNYTGIGISCGGGLCNVSLAYLSVPVLSFSIPKAGDYIDQSAAAMTGERANRIRMVKEESFFFNGFHPDKVQQVLAVYYDDMIKTLVNALRDSFTSARNMPKISRPIPIVLSGGTSLPKGFRERFEKIFKESNLPIPVSEIKVATNPLEAAARGALVAALAEM
jgi:actin-like ATPase involved in cell morphogenesis